MKTRRCDVQAARGMESPCLSQTVPYVMPRPPRHLLKPVSFHSHRPSIHCASSPSAWVSPLPTCHSVAAFFLLHSSLTFFAGPTHGNTHTQIPMLSVFKKSMRLSFLANACSTWKQAEQCVVYPALPGREQEPSYLSCGSLHSRVCSSRALGLEIESEFELRHSNMG